MHIASIGIDLGKTTFHLEWKQTEIDIETVTDLD